MADRVPMTQKGYEQLKKKAEHLKNALRPAAEKRLGIAREMGDLAENAEYDAAREEVWRLDREIAECEERLVRAEIISPEQLTQDKVAFGARVKVRDLENGDVEEFHLVGEGESNVRQNRIAITTPMGQALVGHCVGDKVKVQVPVGTLQFEIVEIAYE